MNERQRFVDALTFQRPDRVPFAPGYARESTVATWRQQGLPADVHFHDYMLEQLGIPRPAAGERVSPGMSFLMIPQFEEKIIEHRPAKAGVAVDTEGRTAITGTGASTAIGADAHTALSGTYVVQDWKGNICEISDRYDPRYLRNAYDFVTRNWIKCPVESREDWADMKRRYVVDDSDRWPDDWKQRAGTLRDRSYPSGLVFSGPFWQLREWMGFENLCMAFVDDPAFVEEMVEFWQAFVSEMLRRTLADYVPDYITINEDMAYKEKPMIGPAMCREFLLPCWAEWAGIARGAGVPIFECDSDGHVGELIPVWLDAGFNCNSPLEVAAGNDLPAYRKQYGERMAYRGGVDKRKMAAGGDAIVRELDRLKPVLDAGGYIPSCDHGVPPDVSWPNYLRYCERLAKMTGWL